jgi:hypothetical protein
LSAFNTIEQRERRQIRWPPRSHLLQTSRRSSAEQFLKLARLTGFGTRYLSKIQNCLNVPFIGTLAKIAQTSAFDLDHFLHPEESFSEDVVSAVHVR